MNQILKTRNLSANQTLQAFNSTRIFKSKDNENLFIDDLDNISKYLYEVNFSKILLENKHAFLSLIDNKVQEIIKYHFDDVHLNTTIIKKSINKIKTNIENKYLNDYTLLNAQYNKNKNEFQDEDRVYITNYIPHCINSQECATHLCSINKKGKFILIQQNSNDSIINSKEEKYVICLECKKCYKSTCMPILCTTCNKVYFSKIISENDDKNKNIVLATWEKYHCGGTLTDQIMKCIKCKKELYINLLTNKLICLNKSCNFESKPQSILWKCIFCSKEFRSKAKAYNPVEFQLIKKAIKIALLMKIKAKPKALLCCKRDVNNIDFYHKEECRGLIFKGYLDGKDILVCKKCHAMNFIDKFNWICPLCGRKFHSYALNSKSIHYIKKSKNNIPIKSNENEINNELENEFLIPNKLNKETDCQLSKDEQNKDIDRNNIITRSKNLNFGNKFYLANKYLNSYIENQDNDENNNADKGYNSECNDNLNHYNNKLHINSRNDLIINENLGSENNGFNIKKKQKRITLFEVLEKRKKKPYKDSIKNNLLKDTKDPLLKENNLNKTKNIEDKSSNINNDNLDIISQESSSNNNFNSDKKSDININLNKTNNLMKYKSSNHLKETKNNNIIEHPNKNKKSLGYKDNHQTNYLYTTNSNYNIKVSLNINNNICQYSSKDEANIENKGDKNIYETDGLNKIKEIYLKEILKNTGISLDNVINDNIGNILKTMNDDKNNNIKPLENKQYPNNAHNLSNNKLHLESLSPDNKRNKNYIYLFKKNDYGRKSENIKNFGYKSIHNNLNSSIFKNSDNNLALPSQKNDIINIEYNSEQNKKKEAKKFGFNRLNFFNKDIEKNKNQIHLYSQNLKKGKENNNDIHIIQNIPEPIKEEELITNDNNGKNDKNIENSKENNRLSNSKNSKNKKENELELIKMKNIIVSQEVIERLTKESKIPIFSDKEYDYIRPIGEGAYGLIYLVENTHNKKQYALKKILCKDLYEIMKHKTQLELIYSLKHKNIMELYNIQYKYLDSTTYAIYALMERAQNDWSVDIRKRRVSKKLYKEEEIINILKQVVAGLSFMQQQKITHRDIKPQNILLFKGNIFKIADLGEAKAAENINQQMTLRGSELYMSPLLYDKYNNNKKEVFHNPYKSDVFSLGFSCLYAMNLNLNIIENIRELKNMKMIVNSINKDLKDKNYSDKLIQIIYKMIEIDENKRYDFIELEKDLNSIF